MQIEIQIPKAVLFDVKYTVEQATNFAKKEVALGFYMQKRQDTFLFTGTYPAWSLYYFVFIFCFL